MDEGRVAAPLLRLLAQPWVEGTEALSAPAGALTS